MLEAQRESANKPLPERKEWLFGLGTAGMTMCNSVYNTYFFFFLTNVVCMSTTLMGKITSISSIMSMALAPLVGAIITRFRFKTGKYFTWTCIVFPIGMVLYVMCFVKLDASESAQFWYYMLCYVLGVFLTNFNEMGLIGFLPQVCKDRDQAIRASSKRSVLATCGTVLYSLITVKLVGLLGGGDLGKGYLYVFIIYAVLCVGLYQYVGQALIRPYDFYPVKGGTEEKTEVKEKGEEVPFMAYVNAYIKNPGVILYQLGGAFKGMASRMYNACINYYLIYVCNNGEMLTYYLLAANLGLLVGSYIAIPVATRLGKKWTEFTAYTGFAVSLIAGYFIGVGNAWVITVLIFIGRAFSGLDASLLSALYGDLGDYYYWKSGYRLNSFYVSMSSLISGLAMTFMATITATVLTKIGYSAGVEITPTIAKGLTQLVTLWPGVPLLVAAILFLAYPLNEKKMDAVRADIAAGKFSPDKK